MNAPENLYQAVIMRHNRSPMGARPVVNPTHVAEGFNRICGDRISISISVENNRISEIGYSAQCCALCRASASILVGTVESKGLSRALEIITGFEEMLSGGVWTLGGDAAVFECIKDYPARSKCVLLPWKTMAAAISHQIRDSLNSDVHPIVSTEEEEGGT